MKYSIVYSSNTGNTKMLAEAIYNQLNKNDIIYLGRPNDEALEADYIYLGFWTDKGTADMDTLEFIKKIKNKMVFLFGTAGFGVSDDYFQKIITRVKGELDKSNTVTGSYMCQGKMPVSVRERYIKLKESKANIPNLDLLIDNFDKALSHPTDEDIKKLIERI